MFFKTIGKPSKLKKIIYILATTFLSLILSLTFHALIEIYYLNWSEKQNRIVNFYGNCSLPPILQNIILIIGIVGGFYLGNFWWKKVYIERAWLKKYHRK